MTLEEAISHAEEVANTNERLCETVHPAMQLSDYGKCAEEHRQLAEWLKDYKRLLEQESKTGHCKDCKYFEYDRVTKVDEMPIIVANEICNKWGNGCKTREDGYCFLFEPQESEEQDTK